MSAPLIAFDVETAALLLDVDGTLLDIAPTPDAVFAASGLRESLAFLLHRMDGALALVSGRPICDLDSIFTPLRLAAVGVHGAEIRRSPADKVRVDRNNELDRTLRASLIALAQRFAGVGIEDKGPSVALHFRAVPDYAESLIAEVNRTCAQFPPGTCNVLHGKAVVEIKSPGFDKGTGIRELMRHPPFAGRTPIFIGDDTTDEAGFAVMPEFGGLSVAVGDKISGADAAFDTPSDVRAWLAALVRAEAVAEP